MVTHGDGNRRTAGRHTHDRHSALKCSILQKTAYLEGPSPAATILGATLGRPKNFDAFRKLCQKICHEKVTHEGEVMTRLEVILRDWAASKDPQKQIALVQYGFGKPPDKIEATGLEDKTSITLYFDHERPGWQQPDGSITAVNGEGTRRPLLPDAE